MKRKELQKKIKAINVRMEQIRLLLFKAGCPVSGFEDLLAEYRILECTHDILEQELNNFKR